ncbi:MAG: hydroxymethylbilane synthase [Acidimicrobiales bacterium]
MPGSRAGPAGAGALRIATRGSALARWQAGELARRLQAAHPGLEVEMVVVSTLGDRRPDVAVWEMGGQGVFVKDVQATVAAGAADVAVHSAKDLPSAAAGGGLVLGAFLARGDPRDALVGRAFEDLPAGAAVATGSVRRRAQMAWLRPDLTFTGLRGNIGTRLARVPPGGAVVVAAAALDRLGRRAEASTVFPVEVMVPQVGQGAIAAECRAGDEATAALLAAVDDPATRVAVACERAFLARLGGGCDLPVGAHATLGAAGGVVVDGLVASGDGRVVLRDRARGAGNGGGGVVVDGLVASGDGRVVLRDRARGAGNGGAGARGAGNGGAGARGAGNGGAGNGGAGNRGASTLAAAEELGAGLADRLLRAGGRDLLGLAS